MKNYKIYIKKYLMYFYNLKKIKFYFNFQNIKDINIKFFNYKLKTNL